MKQGNRNRQNRSKQIALGGIFSALSLALMFTANIFPFFTFAAPMFAGVLLLPLVIEFGAKVALLAYTAIALLALFIMPDKEMALFFLFLFGYYPILQPLFAKIKHRILRIIPQLLLFDAALAIIYSLLLLLFASPGLEEEFSSLPAGVWILILLVANFTFLIYDVMIDKMRLVYYYKLRPKLFGRR